jgi:membrane protease YdiL (CAAX protease family)
MRAPGSEPTLHPVLALVVVGLGWTLMQVVVLLLFRVFGVRLALCGGEIALALPAVLALALSGVGVAEGLALQPVGRRTLWLSLAVGGCFWGTSAGLLALQSTVWPPSPELLQMFRQLHAALRPSGPVDAVFSVLSIAVAPAVCEEALFRGVVLPSFVRPMGAAGAAVASALLFGLIHYDDSTFYRLPFAFAIGLGLAIVRLRTGSLLPSTIAHATVNTITFLIAPFTDTPDGTPDARPLVAVAILAVGLAASTIAIRAISPRSR